jgi:hypothetical protein
LFLSLSFSILSRFIVLFFLQMFSSSSTSSSSSSMDTLMYIACMVAVHKKKRTMVHKVFGVTRDSALANRVLKNTLLDMIQHTGGPGDPLSSSPWKTDAVVTKLLEGVPLTNAEQISVTSDKSGRAAVTLSEAIDLYQALHPLYDIVLRVEKHLLVEEHMLDSFEV